MPNPADSMVALLLGPGPSGYGVSSVSGAICTTWNTTTGENTVSDGARRWTNLPFLGLASAGSAGLVLLLNTPNLPVILGRLTLPTPP